ncbi:hypothetical protein DC522_32935 [Microvirga sp. KLBC 81]|nr:hypothetical protein DC522_32935 [Microvirga sp. KLBC 81]
MDTGKWHTIMVASDEEEERKTAALKASLKWTEGDNLMVIRLVAVEHAEVESRHTPNETVLSQTVCFGVSATG